MSPEAMLTTVFGYTVSQEHPASSCNQTRLHRAAARKRTAHCVLFDVCKTRQFYLFTFTKTKQMFLTFINQHNDIDIIVTAIGR